MFDISFGELLLICVVALVVLGPERLPTVARTLGALIARAQRFVANVKTDIGQQSDLASLSSLKQEIQQTAFALKEQLIAEVEQAQSSIRQVAQEAVNPEQGDTSDVPASQTAAASSDSPLATAGQHAAEPDVAAVQNENQLDLFSDLAPPPSHPDNSHPK